MSRSAGIETVAEELGATAVRGDIRDPAALDRLVQAALSLGRVDGVVVNTGHPAQGDLLDLADEDWRDAMELVLLPTVRLMRHLVPVFRQQGGGSVVAVSTYAAAQPVLDYALSAVFRAGLGAFIKLCVERHAAEGLRINAVLPGFMNNWPETEEAVRTIPAGRYGKVEELGRTIAFLLSDGAGYINGQSLLVDGGLVRAL